MGGINRPGPCLLDPQAQADVSRAVGSPGHCLWRVGGTEWERMDSSPEAQVAGQLQKAEPPEMRRPGVTALLASRRGWSSLSSWLACRAPSKSWVAGSGSPRRAGPRPALWGSTNYFTLVLPPSSPASFLKFPFQALASPGDLQGLAPRRHSVNACWQDESVLSGQR